MVMFTLGASAGVNAPPRGKHALNDDGDGASAAAGDAADADDDGKGGSAVVDLASSRSCRNGQKAGCSCSRDAAVVTLWCAHRLTLRHARRACVRLYCVGTGTEACAYAVEHARVVVRALSSSRARLRVRALARVRAWREWRRAPDLNADTRSAQRAFR
eukprot:4757623-Pleurochrysis_carterae.AAC.1